MKEAKGGAEALRPAHLLPRALRIGKEVTPAPLHPRPCGCWGGGYVAVSLVKHKYCRGQEICMNIHICMDVCMSICMNINAKVQCVFANDVVKCLLEL